MATDGRDVLTSNFRNFYSSTVSVLLVKTRQIVEEQGVQ